MPRSRRSLISEKKMILWSTEQDIILIENNTLSLDDLAKILPFKSVQIMERKEELGLIRRAKYLQKYLE